MDCSPPGSFVHGNSPGKNTGVGCHALLQGIFPTQGINPGLPHCRQILYHLSHQGSPIIVAGKIQSLHFSLVAQSCLTFCSPLDCSTPGFPVRRRLLELAQTHVYWVGDAILPAHPLPPSPPFAFNLLKHQGLFQWVSSLHQVAKNNFLQTGLLFPTSTSKSFFIPYPSLLSPLSTPTPSNFSYLSPQWSTNHAVTSLINNF